MQGNETYLIDNLLIAFGVLYFLAAVFNWKYFYKQRKAKMLIDKIGLSRFRIVLAILGLFFAIVGFVHSYGTNF